MVGVIRKTYTKLSAKIKQIEATSESFRAAAPAAQFCIYTITRFAKLPLIVLRFSVALPLYLVWSPTKAFQALAPRAENGTYLLAYNQSLKESRLTAATTTLLLTMIALKVISVVFVTELFFPPKQTLAYSSSATLNPTWDRTSYFNDQFTPFPDCSTGPIYNCENATATILKSGLTQIDVGCGEGAEDEFTYRSTMQYDLASIPNNATITDVDLTINVSTTTSATVTILRTSIDNIQSSSCTGSGGAGMYTRMGTGTTYTTASDWTTTGAKTYDLGATADSDVQSRISSGDTISISITASATTTGQYSSTDAASNKPQLVVSYTAPPQAPTEFSHQSNTTSIITWSWTDNATADTSNVIHDASHAIKCSTGAVSGTGSTGTCQETTLSANTQYTRHVNVIDNEGNTDASTASAYTSIETPTGVSFSNVTATGLDVAATGALSNLTSGSSGVYCEESVTSTNSGWVQSNSWPLSGLTPNTQYSVRCKARNGDGDETSLTSAATKYTLAAAPDATSGRSTGGWYTTAAFDFAKTSGWGAGGVQYLRYVFNQSATYAFTGTESTWSSAHANCPGGVCTTSGTTLVVNATAAGQNWHLHLLSYNGDNVVGSTSTTGPFWFDGLAPTISEVAATATQTALTASWLTSEAATSRVEYGTTTDYGSQTPLDSALVTNHSVTVAGLTPGTTYHFRVRSTDAAGNATVSADAAKATLTPDPATITDLQVSSVTSASAVIVWMTSLTATSSVDYGLTEEYGSAVSDTSLVTAHQVGLTGLAPGTTYHFRVSGVDVNNQAIASEDQAFTTSTAETPAPPATPTLVSPVVNDIVFDRRPTFSGLAASGVTVIVMIDGAQNGTTTSKSSATGVGEFSYRPVASLTLGRHRVSVAARDSIGQTSNASIDRSFLVAAASTPRKVATAVIKKTKTPTIVIAGKAPRTGKARIILDRSVIKTIKVKKSQQFRHVVSVTKNLAPGRHTLVLQFLDSRGRVRETSRLVTFTKAGKQSSREVPIEVRVDGGLTLSAFAERQASVLVGLAVMPLGDNMTLRRASQSE